MVNDSASIHLAIPAHAVQQARLVVSLLVFVGDERTAFDKERSC